MHQPLPARRTSAKPSMKACAQALQTACALLERRVAHVETFPRFALRLEVAVVSAAKLRTTSVEATTTA